MEFKDRVANKPNRVKLTYDEGGASVYATVELADEPIEEGTPLNALNMNKLLNKEDNNYIVESGFASSTGDSTSLYYEKYNNGIIKIYARVVCYTLPSLSTALGGVTFKDCGMLDNSLINCTSSVNADIDNVAHLRLTAEYVYRPTSQPYMVTAVVYRTDDAQLSTERNYTADLSIIGRWK